jgi:hypothetical protein
MPFQRISQATSDVQTLLAFIERRVSAIKTIVVKAGENVEMVVPHILISGGTIMLTRGDALTAKCFPHRIRNQASCPKEVTAQLVGNVQRILVMDPRDNEAVAPNSCVVMQRNERKNARLNQNDCRSWTLTLQSLRQVAERTLVASRRVLHEVWRSSGARRAFLLLDGTQLLQEALQVRIAAIQRSFRILEPFDAVEFKRVIRHGLGL